jgi:hypothetical protein
VVLFLLACSDLYKNNLKQYVENKYVQEATGFKPLAEIINGRAAMLVSGSDRLICWCSSCPACCTYDAAR